MIHFDFIVEDVDAENIMCALRDYALKNDEDIMDYEARKDLTRGHYGLRGSKRLDTRTERFVCQLS